MVFFLMDFMQFNLSSLKKNLVAFIFIYFVLITANCLRGQDCVAGIDMFCFCVFFFKKEKHKQLTVLLSGVGLLP